MRRHVSALAALAATLLGSVPVAAQQGATQILEAAAERYGEASSVCADFVQLRSVPLLRSEVTHTGRLCSADPNLFAMRFTDPAGDVILSDGSTQWIYRPSENPRQVYRGEIGPGTGGQDFYRELLENPGDKYEVTCAAREDVDGVPTTRLCLRAKSQSRNRPDMVWIDVDAPVIRKIHFVEENGSERTITLSHIVFDTSPPAGWFEFTPPSGAIIIDM